MNVELLPEAEGVDQAQLDRAWQEHRRRFASGEEMAYMTPDGPCPCITKGCHHAARWRVWRPYGPTVPLSSVYWCDGHLEAHRTEQADLFGEGAS